MKKKTEKIDSLIKDPTIEYIKSGKSDLRIYEIILRLQYELDFLKKLIESE